MKRFTFIIAALLIGSMCFAQKITQPQSFRLDKPVVEQNTEKSSWNGNISDYTHIHPITAGYEIIIRPEKFTATIGATITKVKFKTLAPAQFPNPQYSTYTNNSFTIKIYEGVNATNIDAIGDDELTCLGRVAYTQDYTQTDFGDNEVTLTTPYTITNNPFWISVVANGSTIFLYKMETIASGLTQAEFQANADSYVPQMNGNYLYTDSYQGEDYVSINYGRSLEENGTTIEVGSMNFCLAYYLEDGQAYQESSDIEVTFGYMTSATGFQQYSSTEPINLGANDDFPIIAFVRNNGPDEAYNVNADVKVNGMSVYNNPPLILDTLEVDNLYLMIYTDTLTADFMNQLQLTGTFTFEISAQCATDGNTTNNIKTITVVRPETTSIDSELSSSVSVYPNPASDMFTVANAEGSTIEVYNALGQVVTTIENASANQTIDASNLSAGAYYVKVNAQVVKMNVVK